MRETFAELCELADPYCECEDAAPDNPHHLVEYRADSGNKYPGQWDDAYPDEIENAREEGYLPRWKPLIFMPRWASRIKLQVEGIRVERVQDISEEDALAEGTEVFFQDWGNNFSIGSGKQIKTTRDPIDDFRLLWDSINEKRGFGWDENPWAWVVNFSVMEEVDPVEERVMNDVEKCKSLIDNISRAVPKGYILFFHAGFKGGCLMLVNSETLEIVYQSVSFQVDGGDPGTRLEGEKEYLEL